MKKRTALILALIVAMTVAVGMIVLAGATGSADPVDIRDGDGMRFDGLSLYHTAKDNPVTHTLTTYEATVRLPAGYTEDAGSIIGNYKGTALGGVRLRIREGGYVTLFYTGNGDYVSMNMKDVCVATGNWVHLVVVDDVTNGELRCYLDGELAQTYKMSDEEKNYPRDVSGMPMCLGGSFEAGTGYFKGDLLSVAVYSDVRTEEEIIGDASAFDLDDPNLVMAYHLDAEAEDLSVITDLAGNYNVYNNRMNPDWAEPANVAQPEGYDYSIAVLGDTQIMSRNYPEEFERVFDWLLSNRFEHRIAHVLNVGDLTNDNTDAEWTVVRDQYFRLNGKLDYTLVRGDHDVLDNDDEDKERNVEMYDDYFGVPAYTDRYNTSGEEGGFYKADGTVSDSWRTITVGTKNVKYLIVTVDKYTGFDDEKAVWLSDLLTSHPDHKAIITTHAYVGPEGELVDDSQIKGTKIWECVKAHSNVEMVICGHMYAYGVLWTKAEGDNGNVINQILTNPQGPDFDREGGTGMIAMLYFDESGDNAQVRFYSPVIDKYFVGNNNGYSEATEYKIDTSSFEVSLKDMNAPTAVAPVEADRYIKTDAYVGIYAEQWGDTFEVILYSSSDYDAESGVATILFDPAKLSYKETYDPLTLEYDNEKGYVRVEWSGREPDEEGYCHIATLVFDQNLDFDEATELDLNVLSLSGKDENGNGFYHKGITVVDCAVSMSDQKFVYYNEGDDFVEKMNEAVELSKHFEVFFMMGADFTATESLTFGKVNAPTEGKINVSSLSYDYFPELNTGGYNLIFSGNWYFNALKIGGNGEGAANSLFFPNGSRGEFGANIQAGEKTANLTGADIDVSSGKYYYVGAVIDKSIGIPVADPVIVVRGNTVADCVCGGARLKGDVYGCADVSILDNAIVTRYATPSGYASYGLHDGNMYVNTTGTIGRLCGAVGPVGSKGYSPKYSVTIDNVNCTTTDGFMGARSIVKGSKVYADVSITVNGGNFTKASFGGLYVTSDYTGVTFEGASTVVINGGKFSASVYGGGYLDTEGSVQMATTDLSIYGGEFTSKCTIHGGSDLNRPKTKHVGESNLTIYGGSFPGQVFGGSLLIESETVHEGDVYFSVYGGVTLGNYVTGGSKFWYNGTGYGIDGGNGPLMTGDVHFNIYDVDKDGNDATVTMNGGRLFAAGYGNSSYAYGEMNGTTYYSYAGIAIPSNAFGGMRAQGGYTRLSGDVYGELDNVTFNGNFYGGSELVGANSTDTGNIYTTLKNVNVSKTVVGASKISKATQSFEGHSTLNYESGTLSGNAVAGCMFTVPNVKINGDSVLYFGTGSTAPTVSSGGKLIGGCLASAEVFTAEGAATEWGMYGSSEVVVEGGTVEAGAYLIGGSYVKGTVGEKSTVNWEKYPVVGGVPGESNTNTTKLTVNGGTVNGPNIYAGSYLATGGQDHGTVILTVNGGKIVMTADGITNYGSVATMCLYPATYYPTNTKTVECNYTLSMMGGTTDFPAGKIGFSGTFDGYNGTIKGNTELNIAVGTRYQDVTGRVTRVTAGMNNPGADALLIGNSTLNVYEGAEVNPTNPVTAGCYAGINKIDSDSKDGIEYGFFQIGDAMLNVYGGSIDRTTDVSGYRSNLDGNVYVNVYGGKTTKNVHAMGDSSTTSYSSVTGDVVWKISGGEFSSADGQSIFGGGDAKSGVTYNEGYNVLGGNLYMEISGGTFKKQFYLAGENSISENKTAYIKFIGSDYDIQGTFDAYGSACTEYAGKYVIDLLRAEKAVTVSDKFTLVIPSVTGEIEVPLTAKEAAPGTALSTLIPEKVKINGNEYNYADVIAFDEYTEYDNCVDFYTDEAMENAVTEMPENAGKLYLTLADIPVGGADVKSSFRISSAALALHHDLSIIFKANIDLFEEGMGYTDPYLAVTMNGETVELEPVADDAAGKLTFTFENIAPHMMGDEITLVLHATIDGKPVESAEVTYSVLTYCDNMLANSNDDNLKTLLVDLLNYGAAAQEYKEYKTDELANIGLSEDEKKLATGDEALATVLEGYADDKNVEFAKAEIPTVTLNGAGLVLDNSVTVRFSVRVPEGTSLDGLKVEIYNEAGTVKRVHAASALTEYTPENAEEGMTYYYVDFDGFNAGQMSELLFFRMVNGEGKTVSDTLRYSIGAYAYAKTTDASSDAKLVALVKAMIKYGVSAEQIA